MLIKIIVHMRRNPTKWAVWSSPFFFLVAGTICTLSIVYKGSPKLGLNKKPKWYVVSVIMGVGGGLCILSAIFFVPWLHARVIKKDHTVKWYMIFMGPLLWKRPAPADAEFAKVPNYNVVQKEEDDFPPSPAGSDIASVSDDRPMEMTDKGAATTVTPQHDHERTQPQLTYKELVAAGEERLHAKLRKKRGPLGWAMRLLHDNPMGPGQIYEFKNMAILAKRIPAMVVVGLLYGAHYDIHAARNRSS